MSLVRSATDARASGSDKPASASGPAPAPACHGLVTRTVTSHVPARVAGLRSCPGCRRRRLRADSDSDHVVLAVPKRLEPLALAGLSEPEARAFSGRPY